MFGIDFVPGLVMGIREGLEAFLIVAIMLEYLNKTNRLNDKKAVFQGLGLGILASVVIGLVLFGISNAIGANSDNVAKLWESVASFVALLLITTFIFFMLKNRHKIVSDIQDKMKVSISKMAILLLAFVMVAREGAEIALFVFASAEQGSYLAGALIGIVTSGVLSFLIYKSLIKVNLKVIFNVTLFYLILQAGFMFGYSLHELLSYFKAEGILEASNVIYTKMFDLSDTFLYHKEQPIGIALYATVGWYSKPEVIQFLVQYLYTGAFIYLFFKTKK